MTKYIFITGGVVSGLGKGIAAASLGLILKTRGFKVVNQKFDPYLNIDPGTMNPYQHGEVFVTDDGAETDLDLGHYERFTDATLSQSSNTTSGRVYLAVLNKEREGGFHGGTVQVIPHITEEILRRMKLAATESNPDIVITEIGGTVGDIESLPFIEAIRQIKYDVGEENCCYIHLTLIPYMRKSEELKTKPTQHSVKELQELGIKPDVIMVRTEHSLDTATRERLASFCNIPSEALIQNFTARSIYEVPLQLEQEGIGDAVCNALGLKCTPTHLEEWKVMVDRYNNPKHAVRIALVGKYVKLHDSYLSIVESLNHASFVVGKKVNIKWVDSDSVTDATAPEVFKDCAGIILPGGFGNRGIEGMICACRYARVNKLPYFGICLGMQIAVIEYARTVLGYEDANSREFDEMCAHPVIDLMKDQEGVIMGGTMRLGKYPCKVVPGTILESAYKSKEIEERHRHRYEFNNDFREELTKAGLIISGTSPDEKLVESVEVADHFHIGVQFHPEFKSRPNNAGPLFVEFVKACVK